MSAARSVQRFLHRRGMLRGCDGMPCAERLRVLPQCSLPQDRRHQKPETRMYSKQGKALSHQTKQEQGAKVSHCQSRGALAAATEAAAQRPVDLSQAQQDPMCVGVDGLSHPQMPQMIPWRRRLRSRRLPAAQVMESEQTMIRDRWSDYSQSVLRDAPTPLPPDAPAMGFHPHWVLIWQEEAGGLARMYVSDRPFTSEDEREHAGSSESELVTTVGPGMSFAIGDVAAGAWRSYLIGIVGEVSLDEDDMQWPNQVLHGDRTRHNLRSIHDLAQFLAMPCEDDVQEHLENLTLLATERRYSRMWCWHLLKDRWGEEYLASCGLTREIVLKRT